MGRLSLVEVASAGLERPSHPHPRLLQQPQALPLGLARPLLLSRVRPLALVASARACPDLAQHNLAQHRKAVASLPGSDVARPMPSTAAFLLNALIVAVVFVGGTFGFLGLFNLITDRL